MVTTPAKNSLSIKIGCLAYQRILSIDLAGYGHFRTITRNWPSHFVAILISADHDIRPLRGFTAAKLELRGVEIRTEDRKEARVCWRRRTRKRRCRRLCLNVAGDRTAKGEKENQEP
jgi:hypothetical protein